MCVCVASTYVSLIGTVGTGYGGRFDPTTTTVAMGTSRIFFQGWAN